MFLQEIKKIYHLCRNIDYNSELSLYTIYYQSTNMKIKSDFNNSVSNATVLLYDLCNDLFNDP